MTETKKTIIDAISEILTRFVVTDDWRINPEYLSYKVDQVRADLIVNQYNNPGLKQGIIDMIWLSDLGVVNFNRVGFSDDVLVSCGCDVGKTTIPQIVSLNSNNGNQDLGLYSVISMCGTKQVTPKRMFQWNYCPPGNTNALFTYYWRINTQLYISNPEISQLRMVGILLNPEDGYLNNSMPVLSGALVNTTVYIVKGGTIVYNHIPYANNDTFTAGVTTTFAGNGKVYLNSQVEAYNETDPYPASGEMIRQIELEILTKEFKIEAGELTDVRNDSVDDSNKVPQV